MTTQRTLRVFPNPYHHLDHEGRPCGVFPYEPEGDGVHTFDMRRFVGATLQAVITQKFPKGDARQSVQDTTFVFSDEAVDVTNSPYYRAAIKSGEILAADAATARIAGVVFVEPKDALEIHKAGALHHLKNILAHEEHDESHHEALTSHAFGPMSEAVAARKTADTASSVAEIKANEAKAAKSAEAEAAKKKAPKTEFGGDR